MSDTIKKCLFGVYEYLVHKIELIHRQLMAGATNDKNDSLKAYVNVKNVRLKTVII